LAIFQFVRRSERRKASWDERRAAKWLKERRIGEIEIFSRLVTALPAVGGGILIWCEVCDSLG
jgi:hypothetical protein